MIERYGVTFSDGCTDAEIELWMGFDINRGQPSLHTAKGFLGAFTHLQRAIDIVYNNKENALIWNDWTEGMLKEMIESGEWVISGPSSSWKSTCAACYGHAFWIADPLNTKVIPTVQPWRIERENMERHLEVPPGSQPWVWERGQPSDAQDSDCERGRFEWDTWDSGGAGRY